MSAIAEPGSFMGVWEQQVLLRDFHVPPGLSFHGPKLVVGLNHLYRAFGSVWDVKRTYTSS